MPHCKKQMISFFLTTRCNLCCSYCYNAKERNALEEQSLSFEIAKAGVDMFFAENDSRHIRFYGPGEPTQEFALTGQIVLLGIQVKKVYASLNRNSDHIKKVEESICFTNEMTAILSSGEERRIEFAKRRLREVEDIFKTVSKEKDSGLLSVSTYYKELDNLKETLLKNKNIKSCMIWAMTRFSDSEWEDEDNDLEKIWCDSLKELAKKVTTKRVCIISSSLNQLLQEDKEYFETQLKDWKENEKKPELIKTKNLKSFYDYISTYYGVDAKQHKVENFCVHENSKRYSELGVHL